MKTKPSKLLYLAATCFIILTIAVLSAFRTTEKVKIGFLIHDLVADRWNMDTKNFASKIEELGGEVILKNALGDATAQVKQGKELIDQGIKVIAVVPEDGKVLGELVDYADKAGAKIIAYDRMILNCNLHYYISFNSEKVGELMATHALRLKPKGNYVILNGPSSDNNALLVKKGVMNKLKQHIDKGNIKILLEKEMDSWYGLSSFAAMNEFTSVNKQPIDVVIAGSDDLAIGVADAVRTANLPTPVITGQDASLEACRNIMTGYQSMTVYKSIKKLSSEAAILSMKLAKGEKIKFTTTLNNGKKEVPSILFDPVAVDKSNLRETVVADQHIKESDLN